ncbi:enoyl-CoA hydratase-related protein [Bacillus massilinigeriensis]|uniref:enoyl-CoA hydratase-related protein n=1 Tax=Bacillus mediterraneensis TaxID=1805474 RepID=UPI0008F81888|nr:enoyl-CoA hydratase-related protein [Bacillus mediterraneensis]
MKNILTQKENGIAYITINRPEIYNCFNYETLGELGETVESLHHDNETKVVIFTGAGEKAFSAGADLKERKNLTSDEVIRNVHKIRDVFQAVSELPQPTIAAVNGVAFGGGFELILACDFRIASSNTLMGLTEVSWGIIPGAGGTQRLTRLIGEMRAKELILTARKIRGEMAMELGILTSMVEAGKVMEACRELAEEIMQNAPIAVRQAKYAISRGSGVTLETGLAIETKAYEVTIPTKDRTEALQAFSEKRKPVFTAQ